MYKKELIKWIKDRLLQEEAYLRDTEVNWEIAYSNGIIEILEEILLISDN